MLKKLLFIFIIFFNLIFAQENPKENIDSLRIAYKYNLLFNSPSNLNLPANIDFIPSTDNFSGLNSFEMNRIKNDMKKSFSIYRAGQNKYHLGVVTDVLGYVSTAAAAGLAAYHLYKYRKEYGIK